MNSKLRDILEQHANWAHRWGKDNPDTYIYGTPTFKPRALETVEAEKAIRKAILADRKQHELELLDRLYKRIEDAQTYKLSEQSTDILIEKLDVFFAIEAERERLGK